MVILLGAGVLLLDAGLSLAFAGPMHSDLRRAGVALPLIALAVVPSTLLRPHFPYLQGVLLFGLIALFMWGERIARADFSAVLCVCVLAGAGAMVLAPALDRHKPWINYEALANGLAPAKVETFNWAQTYGPITWPRKGHEVLDVSAQKPQYWKAEDLDVFDGGAWIQGSVPPTDTVVSKRALAQWTEQVTVTIRAMKTNQVIAAGTAFKPTDISGVLPGISAGTWSTTGELAPGDSYRVSVYAPLPTKSQMTRAGEDYPAGTASYRSIALPTTAGLAQIQFPAFHSRAPILTGPQLRGIDGAALVRSLSVLAGLRARAADGRRAATPYAFVNSVEHYLQARPTPTTNTRRRANIRSRPSCSTPGSATASSSPARWRCSCGWGACRRGWPPASRPGPTTPRPTMDRRRDLDAHAWVEAWFPGVRLGQVRPDPGGRPGAGRARTVIPAAPLRATTRGVGAPGSPTTGRRPRPVRGTPAVSRRSWWPR